MTPKTLWQRLASVSLAADIPDVFQALQAVIPAYADVQSHQETCACF